ncbi:phospholipid scramblase 2-like isoform X1 [Octopus sinensis]|uniref:Phospholipid scramblase 2-like isoform X1 n=1 Tax=Octopus sinensis TaxID=2607531 RepID=A0A7E6EH12_9MOLL|nr:phospholipid scramblase 2-like isoform X1 [Octopus sinensis]
MADTNPSKKDSDDTPSSQQAAPDSPPSQGAYPTLPPSTPSNVTPQQQSQGYPTQPQSQGYPNQQQPQGYNAQQPPPQGYPNQQQPPPQGYPTQQQPQGYPTQQQPQGYPNQQQPQGYQQPSQAYQQPSQGYQQPSQGYPNQQPPQGYPRQQQPQGHPNQQQPQQGYPNQQQPQGYPTQQQPQGYPNQQPQGHYNQQQGYPNQQPQGYQGQQPGYAPPQSGGYSQPPVSGQGQGKPPAPPGYVPPPTTNASKSQPPVPPGFTSESAIGFNQPRAQPQNTGGQNMPQWMARPENTSNCPPGLEYLTMVDQILIQQQVDALETFTSFESSNKYTVLNSLGQQVYIAAEESELCMRQCLGSMRGFVMHMIDNMGQEVMKVTRELKIGAGCCWFACCNPCSLEVVVEAPVGKVIGKVKQRCSFVRPLFDVMNENDEVVFKIQGPYCMWAGPCCIGDQNFYVHSPDMSRKVATISKEFSGLVKEMFTKADNFGISFPMDLDVNMKATLLGSVFLIDFMYYELLKSPTT